MRQANLAKLNNETNKPCRAEQWDKQTLPSWTLKQTKQCIVEE
jgi:hypothetical protein